MKPKINALDLHYDFSFIGGIIRKFLPPKSILPMVENALTSAIDSLNNDWKNPTKVSGLVGLMGQLFLSLHPTRPFSISQETDLIEFGLDGRLYDSDAKIYVTKDNEQYAQRFERSHSNQIFVHESTIEDIVKGIVQTSFPVTIQTKELNDLFGIYIPQLFEKYPVDTNFKYTVDMDDNLRLHLTPENGISLLNAGLKIEIFAQNKKTWEPALTFSIHADFTSIDVHLQDLVVYTHINPVTIKETYLLESHIGDLPRNNWDQFFEGFFNMAISQINVKSAQFDIKKLDQ